ncbi:MAG: bifunctional riboflavin kinase/FAD synthetase [Hyphomicrobiaceae bacterium]
MIVVEGADEVPQAARGGVYAIGNFDGVHRGHQALLARTRAIAERLDAPAGVMVFEPHPQVFFAPDKPHFRLTPKSAKLALLEQTGLDAVVVMPFDAALAELTAEEFIERVLVEGLAARHIVVGYDFQFGKKRGGTAQTLIDASKMYGFEVSVVEPQSSGDTVYSSSQIRKNLAAGNVLAAATLLGHWWRVTGRVVAGAKRGTGLGYPTANIVLAKGTVLGHGIYAVRVFTEDGVSHQAAAYLGTRPTFDDGAPVLEVFLFDFDDDLYGREISIEFVDFIRGDKAYETGEALAAQMEKDVAHAKERLARAGGSPPNSQNSGI